MYGLDVDHGIDTVLLSGTSIILWLLGGRRFLIGRRASNHVPQEMEHGHAFILLNKAETKSALNGNEVASKHKITVSSSSCLLPCPCLVVGVPECVFH